MPKLCKCKTCKTKKVCRLRVKKDIYVGGALKPFNRVTATKTTQQVLPFGTTTVQWDAKQENGLKFDLGTQTFTAPRDGVYSVSAQVITNETDAVGNDSARAVGIELNPGTPQSISHATTNAVLDTLEDNQLTFAYHSETLFLKKGQSFRVFIIHDVTTEPPPIFIAILAVAPTYVEIVQLR